MTDGKKTGAHTELRPQKGAKAPEAAAKPKPKKAGNKGARPAHAHAPALDAVPELDQDRLDDLFNDMPV